MSRRSLRRALWGALTALVAALVLAPTAPAPAAGLWLTHEAKGTIGFDLPSRNYYAMDGSCRILGGSGWGSTEGSVASYTITQSRSTGAHAECQLTVRWTERACPFFCSIEYRSYTYTRYSPTYYVDQTAPIGTTARVTGAVPNAAGWYRSPGTVVWTAQDPESAIEVCSSIPLGVYGDQASGVLVGACRNNAGLLSSSQFTYKYDASAPELAPAVTPAVVPLGGTAVTDPGATDRTSGVATASCNDGAPLDTSTLGSHTVTCTATDHAGNTATATATYRVAYGFGEFSAPVDTNAVNVVKAGQTVPLKFAVTGRDGAPVTDLASVRVSTRSLACDLGETASLLDESAAGGSGLRHLGEGRYQFNWATPKGYAGSCKTLQLDLGDGNLHTAEFRFTR